VTVCTASVFYWINDSAKGDFSPAIVSGADRKFTDAGLGIGYESSRFKGAALGENKRRIVLVSGDMSAQTALLKALESEIGDTDSTEAVANRFGELLGRHRMREASRVYLTPLGLDSETFITRQREMDPASVARLNKQLQDYEIDAEAIVSGVDDGKNAFIYRVDRQGVISNHSSIGFLSIGSGGIHSSAYFMTLPYNHSTTYYVSLYHTYAAKRRAEVDPYVGKATDMFVTTNHGGTSQVPREVMKVLAALYERGLRRERKIAEVADKKLMELHKGLWDQPATPPMNIQEINMAISSSDPA
jgi:hypothetical protein